MTMELTKIAEALGISPTPCQLDGYIKDSYNFSICDISHIDGIDEEFSVFGKCKDKMSECAALVKENPLLHTYGNAATLYINEHSLREAQALPLPEFNYDTPLRFFPLLPSLRRRSPKVRPPWKDSWYPPRTRFQSSRRQDGRCCRSLTWWS